MQITVYLFSLAICFNLMAQGINWSQPHPVWVAWVVRVAWAVRWEALYKVRAYIYVFIVLVAVLSLIW